MKNRKLHIDVLRIIACFFVIVNHTEKWVCQSTRPSATWVTGILYLFLCKIAVPLFILISGGLLLGKEVDYKKHAVRIGRILAVIVLFSFFYYCVNCAQGLMEFSIGNFFLSIFHENMTNAYWYLYLYLGLLVMLPVIQRMAQAMSRKDYLYFFLITFGIRGVLPIVEHYAHEVYFSQYFLLVIFDVYIGLLLAGYYIERYMDITCKKAVAAGVIAVLCLFANLGFTYIEYLRNPVHYYAFDRRDLTTITLPGICVYIVVKYFCEHTRIPEKLAKGIVFLGGYTFGIYLMGDFFIYRFVNYYDFVHAYYIHPLVDCFLFDVIVFGAGFAVTFVLKKIPGIRRLL